MQKRRGGGSGGDKNRDRHATGGGLHKRPRDGFGGHDDRRGSLKKKRKMMNGEKKMMELEWGEEEVKLAEELKKLLDDRDVLYGGEETLRHSLVVKREPEGDDEKEDDEEDDEKEKKDEEEEEEKQEVTDEVEHVRGVIRAVRATGDVVRLNALISGYAKDKKLHEAVFALSELLTVVNETAVHMRKASDDGGAKVSKSVCVRPTVYTLASFVNACANCDDAELANCAYRTLTRAYGVEPNFVALTALVKVLANTGRVQDAYDVTVSAATAKSDGNNNVKPNLRTFNALLRGCQHFGRGDIALRTLEMMANASGESRPDASSYECAVKALCHTGDMARAAMVISQMEATAGGGKDASGPVDLHRAVLTNTVSAAAYSAYAAECALLGRSDEAKRYLERARTVATLRGDPDLQKQLDRQARGEARGFKRSVMLAGGNQFAVAESRSASVVKFGKHQLRELEAELDLIEEFVRANAGGGAILGGRMFRESTHVLVAKPAGERRVDLRGMAALLAGARTAGQTRLNVELCSGYGDWIVDRAAASDDDDDTLWCAAEILHDRAHSVWSRSVFAGVEARVVTVCADAVDLVCRGLPDDSVDALFVNFPEPAPPGSKHFLEQPHFIANARRVLRMGACMTLLTDNRALSRAAAAAFADVAFAGSTSYSTERPEGYGTSYFDRLWANGKRVARYCVRAHKY